MAKDKNQSGEVEAEKKSKKSKRTEPVEEVEEVVEEPKRKSKLKPETPTRKSPRLHPQSPSLNASTTGTPSDLNLGETALPEKKKRKRTTDEEEENIEVQTKSRKKDKSKKSEGEGVSETPAEKPEDDIGSISKYRICKHTADLLKVRKIEKLFPIQQQTFDLVYEGHDVLGRARTGTGKTLAFALPLVEKLKLAIEKGGRLTRGRTPRILVMTPTRELAKQIGFEFEGIIGKGSEDSTLSVLTVYGGSQYYPQEQALRRGVDIVVGTPGRLIDHLDRGNINLKQLMALVLDEADQMLDVGFADDVEKVMVHAQTSDKHQTLLFSATLPKWINDLVKKYMNPDRKTVDLVQGSDNKTGTKITHLAIACPWQQRVAVLGDLLKVYGGPHSKTIVFADTKKECNEMSVSDHLKGCQVLHGDISQQQREITLAGFRQGKFNCLVATDVAARGLDVDNVDLVVQCSAPASTETYIHRSGRTARAGKEGTCVVFYTPQRDSGTIQQIERRTGIRFKRIGAPQAADIVRASVKSTIRCLSTVHDDVIGYFEEAAKELIGTRDVVRTLASALAYISGHVEPPKSRSLMSSHEGFTTFCFESDYEIRSPTYVWGHVTRVFGQPVATRCRGMKISADMKCALFDVASDDVATITQTPLPEREKCGWTFKVATELPNFEEEKAMPPRQQVTYSRRSQGSYQNRSRTVG